MQEIIPDETLILHTKEGEKFVLLAEGGERFPWANDNGRVVFGPPLEGTDMENLEWHTHRYWVIEALDENEEPVVFSAEDYLRAVETAEKIYSTLEV